MDSCPVRVALRVRPLSSKEKSEGGGTCVNLIPDTPQIVVGTDRSFTFDHVFGPTTPQEDLYEHCVKPLLGQFIDGFNATIFAYGQTGSGKTYSMGTSIDNSDSPSNQGIIPRAAIDLFESIRQKTGDSPHYKSQVLISFLELYNEELLDLLNPSNQRAHAGGSRPSSYHAVNGPTIREDPQGGIYWKGVREIEVFTPDELLDHLYKGLICRTTASTDMNLTSSRSHAIFSLSLKQEVEINEGGDNDTEATSEVNEHPSMRHLISKFHFVDLAGSERLKKTNAVGGRAKEGISINAGLLALGNVISALGDESRKSSHIPYRNSKLTRLLQDSIGGNSQTLMLACISPAEANFLETLNTLKYANRARNIKNRVQVNQDLVNPAEEIVRLKSELHKLRQQLHTQVNSDPSRQETGNNHQKNAVIQQLQSRIIELNQELTRVQAQRDILLLEKAGSSSVNIEDLPTIDDITSYSQLVSELRSQLEAAQFMLQATQLTSTGGQTVEKNNNRNKKRDQTKLTSNPKPPLNITSPRTTKFPVNLLQENVPQINLSQLNLSQLNLSQLNLTALDLDNKALEMELEELTLSINTMPDFKEFDDTRSESGMQKLASINPGNRRLRMDGLNKLNQSVTNLKQFKSVGGTPQPTSPNSSFTDLKINHDLDQQILVYQTKIQDLNKALAQVKKERDDALQSSHRKKPVPASANSSIRLGAGSVKGPGDKFTKELDQAKETILQQQAEITRLKKRASNGQSSPTKSLRPKDKRPLSEFPDYNTSHAHASNLRASYKKKLIDQEIDQFLLGRSTRQALRNLIDHKDKLLVEQAECQIKRDQMFQNINVDDSDSIDHVHDVLEEAEEQLEEIEADLDYTMARIKALELKAESQMKPPSHDSVGDLRDDLFGEGSYRAALKVLHELDPSEVPSMLELLLREIVAKRMEQGALSKKMNDLDKQRVDLELFIKTLKSTTATMTLNYEARIAALQNGNVDFGNECEDFDPFAPHPDGDFSDSDLDLDLDSNSVNAYLVSSNHLPDDFELS